MAAYIFSLDSQEALRECITNGVYGTIFNKQPDGHWKGYHEGTLADYTSMKEGDYVFFS